MRRTPRWRRFTLSLQEVPMLRQIVCALLTSTALSVHAQDLTLPFQGRWFVAQGGDTPNVNHHMAVQAQWYGIDFAKVGGAQRPRIGVGGAAIVARAVLFMERARARARVRAGGVGGG
jgi:hypothetical protein